MKRKDKPWTEVNLLPHSRAEELFAVMWTVNGKACERMETFKTEARAKGYAKEMAALRSRTGHDADMAIKVYKVRRMAVAAYVPAANAEGGQS